MSIKPLSAKPLKSHLRMHGEISLEHTITRYTFDYTERHSFLLLTQKLLKHKQHSIQIDHQSIFSMNNLFGQNINYYRYSQM